MAANDNIPLPPPPGPLPLRRQIYSFGTNNVHYWVNRYNHYENAGEIEDANEIRGNAIREFGQHNWDHALNNPPAHGGRRARKRRSKSRSTRRRHKRKSSKRRKPRRKTRRRKSQRRKSQRRKSRRR